MTFTSQAASTTMPTWDTTVVIPAYNRQNYIGAAIESVLAQTTRPREIVVADDGSTDNTCQVVAGYGDKVRLIRLPGSGTGPSRPRNAAIRTASTEFITLLDSDDYFLADLLARHAEAFRQAPGAGLVVGPSFVDRGGEVDLSSIHTSQVDSLAQLPRRRLSDEAALAPAADAFTAYCRSNYILTASGVSLPRHVWEGVGPFDEGLRTSNDCEFFFRILRTHDMILLDRPSQVYRMHEGNISASNVSRAFKPHHALNKIEVRRRQLPHAPSAVARSLLRAYIQERLLEVAFEYRRIGQRWNAAASYARALKYGASPAKTIASLARAILERPRCTSDTYPSPRVAAGESRSSGAG